MSLLVIVSVVKMNWTESCLLTKLNRPIMFGIVLGKGKSCEFLIEK